ncbi:Ent-kaurene oxidase [Cytospora mali]|uniref:Ent-kaurene oxidase n=1 Tax=Cytospora mali TaxID=578113 RepID=A0A194W1E3_CYTMA|nr:Ent-kaurene oxidase [Valsa mali]
MTELKDAPEEQLSLHALSKDMFTPKHTMNGLEVEDKMNANGSLHTRVLRVVLRSHLPHLCFQLSQAIEGVFDKGFNMANQCGGNDWARLSSFSMAKTVITAANALAFFGPDLSARPSFLQAAADYPEDLFRTAEVLRLTPSLLHPLIAPVLMRNHQASMTMVEHLTPVVEERLSRVRSNLEHSSDQVPKPKDCIQFFVDANSRKGEWTAHKIVQVLLGIWFAAVHQPALTIVYALEDLCEHPEFVEPLRRELSAICPYPRGKTIDASIAATLEEAPLLDAFLKESSRLHPSDSISVRRKALTPFTFRDGTHILPGDVACVPSQAIMRNEGIYTESMKFCPWRFVERIKDTGDEGAEAGGLRSLSRFTDTELEYPLWGLGRHSWYVPLSGQRKCTPDGSSMHSPGRFYASLLLKLFLAHVLMHYDTMLPTTPAMRTFHFRSSIIPTSKSAFLFRKRVRPCQGG